MRSRLLAVGLITPPILGLSAVTGHAVPLPPYNAVFHSASLQVEPVAVRHRGTTVARGPRGGMVAYHHRPVARPVHPIARPWLRPARYYWRPGGAIAAGTAIGFLAATSVSAYAGVAPGPGYCRYYTDPSLIKGFWDVCP